MSTNNGDIQRILSSCNRVSYLNVLTWKHFTFNLLDIALFIQCTSHLFGVLIRGTRQLGPRTTRTETSRPVSEDKSARKRGLVGPYVKTTRTV